MKRGVRFVSTAVLLFVAVCAPAAPQQSERGATSSFPRGMRGVVYEVSLARAKEHIVHVRMNFVATSVGWKGQVQLPVWNALYQVRDFPQYVLSVRAKSRASETRPVRKLDKCTWQVEGTGDFSELEYDIVADLSGPFGAQLNEEHAFFNLAEILMYPVGMKPEYMTLLFSDVPPGWKIRTPLKSATPSGDMFSAASYDELVDSPVEIGNFQEVDFQEGGATYRIIIHGSGDYDPKAIAGSLRKIVAAAVDWMQDRPFQQYTFIYHLPNRPAGGGMEHAYSTAIDVSAGALRNGLAPLESVSAHEFFHLWNVKRIRPASLEPVDYTRENYTRALWFSEGVDSTVSEYILLNAGLTDERRFLQHFAGQIRELQRRPAHLTQSVEESSLDAWLEKYPPYNQPQRSVNYYNKGEIVGYLLDLAVRDGSHGRASLRDVFQWMNQHYAKQGRSFPDSAGVQEAAEAVSGAKLGWFFQKYVAGTEELPYDELLKTVGLRLDRRKVNVATLGFSMAFSGDAPVISSMESGSNAEIAGLREGDIIVSMNDGPVNRGRRSALAGMSPGDAMKLKVRGRDGVEREVNFRLGSREEEDFAIVDLDNVSAVQRALRELWLSSRVQPTYKAVGQ